MHKSRGCLVQKQAWRQQSWPLLCSSQLFSQATWGTIRRASQSPTTDLHICPPCHFLIGASHGVMVFAFWVCSRYKDRPYYPSCVLWRKPCIFSLESLVLLLQFLEKAYFSDCTSTILFNNWILLCCTLLSLVWPVVCLALCSSLTWPWMLCFVFISRS